MTVETTPETGDHGIGLLVHVVHMSDDAQQLRRFYEDVLGGFVYMGVEGAEYLPPEDRWATLLMVGDLCVETMSPAVPVNDRLPVGRFYAKYGRHLHSVGYKVADLPGLARRLLDRGVRIGRPGGGRLEKEHLDAIAEGAGSGGSEELLYFFPSPRDTAGLMVELTGVDMPGDPRALPTWPSLLRMWDTHPLTLRRFSHVTLGVRDLDAAVRTYVDVMQAEPVGGAGFDPDLRAACATVRLGGSLLRLAQPQDADSDLGRHVERWGNMIYSLHFVVSDVDAAERWLNGKAVRTHRLRPGLLVTDVEDSYGAPLFFGTEEQQP